MTFPADLSTVVHNLAIAKKKVAYFEEKLAKMKEAEAEFVELRQRLLYMLDQLGFPEETADLLLAARDE